MGRLGGPTERQVGSVAVPHPAVTEASPLVANPYLQVLRTPHALPMVLAAFIGRLPLSMVGLGCVLLVASETGSYGLGGAIAAVGAGTTPPARPGVGPPPAAPRPRPGVLPGPPVFL